MFCYTSPMASNKNIPFSLIVVISCFNVILSYAFGNNGYEAFITVSIALGILISWQSVQMFSLIRRSHSWLVVKAIYALALTFFWFVIISGVILSISRGSYDSKVITPNINWLIVLIGTIPYLLPRIIHGRSDLNFNKAAVGWVTTLYSVMVLFIAVLGFHDSRSEFGSILLVLAIQLQYLMSHLAAKTSYLERSHASALKLVRKLRLERSDFGKYIIITLVGVPFIVPLVIVLFVSAIK